MFASFHEGLLPRAQIAIQYLCFFQYTHKNLRTCETCVESTQSLIDPVDINQNEIIDKFPPTGSIEQTMMDAKRRLTASWQWLMKKFGADTQTQREALGNGRILDLPLELRTIIYRELLKVDRFECLSTQKLHLDPAILRVCKQLHNEAKEVLYRDNCWIEIVVDDSIQQIIDTEHKAMKETFPFLDFPTTRLGKRSWPHEAALRIDIRDVEPGRRRYIDVRSFITKSASRNHTVICLAALPRYCTMVHSVIGKSMIVEINLGESVRKSWHDDIFFSLEELGFWYKSLSMKVAGFRPSDSCARLADTIAVNVSSRDGEDCLSRLYDYQHRASNLSHRSEVRDTYLNALDYLTLQLYPIDDGTDVWYIDDDDEQMAEIQEIGVNILFEFSTHCIELDHPSYAIDRISLDFECLFSDSKEARRQYQSDAQYHCALAQIAQGEKNAAIFNLMQALAAKPGNELYDAAVDQLENDIRRSTKAEDVMVMTNIQEVLGPLRHQPAGDPVVVDNETKNGYPAGPKWVASAREWKAIEDFQNVRNIHPFYGASITEFSRIFLATSCVRDQTN